MIPGAPPYAATGQRETCPWCGRKVYPTLTYGETLQAAREGSGALFEYRAGMVSGYGYAGTGFCTLRCAAAFGEAQARRGHRLPAHRPG